MVVNYIFKTKPYAHQQEALDQSIGRKGFAFLAEMGTGKSKMLIDTFANLYVSGEIDFALIIAPKGVYRNWPEKELPDHFPEEINCRVVRWAAQPNKAQKAEMQSVSTPFDGLTLFVMNVEAFSSVKGRTAGEWMSRKFGARGLIAVDESTTIKNHKAKRTKTLCKIARGFKYRRIMTGSPISRAPLDIYSQAEFLEPGLLGPSYYAFQAQYAVLKKRVLGAHSFQQVVGYRNLEELSERIGQWSYRVLKKDCLDLPEKTFTTRHVPLSDEQRAMYEKLRNEAALWLQSGEVVSAPQVITQMLRIQQVLSGHLMSDEGELITFPTPRMDVLMDTLEEVSGKALIWSRFRYDIEEITRLLNERFGPGSAASYYGDTTPDERSRVVEEFQKPDSDLRFFVGNPSTGGYGLTLTEANTVIYYANSFSLEQRLQSQDRAHRIGQKNPVTYIDLIADDTIDEKIVEALRNKIDLGAKVLGEEAQDWLKLKPRKKK